MKGDFMFKIAKFKLDDVNNEQVNINFVTQEKNKYENGKKIPMAIKTLAFDISGDDYSFNFMLNCKHEKLLEIPIGKTINFEDYIFCGETWLHIKDSKSIDDPKMNIKITRYLKNKFIILITFYTDDNNNGYIGTIEFKFNLDDYLFCENK